MKLKWPWQANIIIFIACCFIVPWIAGYVTFGATGSMGIADNAVMIFIGIIVIGTLVMWHVWSSSDEQQHA